jgi:hypothetical protein
MALVCTAPLVVSGYAAVIGAPAWVAAILLLPAYALLFELIQP